MVYDLLIFLQQGVSYALFVNWNYSAISEDLYGYAIDNISNQESQELPVKGLQSVKFLKFTINLEKYVRVKLFRYEDELASDSYKMVKFLIILNAYLFLGKICLISKVFGT